MKAWITRYPVLTLVFLVLSIQFSIVWYTGSLIPAGLRMADVPEAHRVFRFRVFSPLILAVLLTWYIEGVAGVKTLFGAYGKYKVPRKWYAMAASWKFLFCYVAWAVADYFGIIPWPGATVDDMLSSNGILMSLLRSMPYILGIALVEETTWMKYCATRLQGRHSALTAYVFTGVAWGLWYLPMLLLGEGVPDGVPWYMFLLSMVGLAVILGWVYNMTHSGLILLIMQVVSNIAFFVMPALPTWHNGKPVYVIAFIIVEVTIATLLVIRYGPRNMGPHPRPTWSTTDAEVSVGSYVVDNDVALQPIVQRT